jgi:hypothetical protein
MRRRSLVVPLLLIATGSLFLTRNLMPELPLGDYAATYWPFLLILWGGLRLLELTVWNWRGRALPPHGLSGGEWVLVALVCMVGMGWHAARGFTAWLPRAGMEWSGLEVFGESTEYPVQAAVEAGAAPRVTIESFRGTARITGGEGTAVRVTGHQTVRSLEAAPETEYPVEVVRDGDRVTIRVRQSPPNSSTGRRRIRAELDITVPRGASMAAANRDGDLTVSGIAGSLDLTGQNASARLENIGGAVRLDMTGAGLVRAVGLKSGLDLKGRGDDIDLENIAGEVWISGSWSGLAQFRGLAKPLRWNGPRTSLSAEAIPGELRMSLGDIYGSRVRGPLRIEAQTKDIHLTELSDATSIRLERGDVRLRTGPVVPEITVRVQAGDVEIAVPEKAQFQAQMVTERGAAFSDFGGEAPEGRRGARINKLGGGAAVNVQVQRGDVYLRRAETSATPAVLRPPARLPRPVDQ